MIDLQNVNKTYSEDIPALKDINLHIDKGEFVFIVGVSGSGKSTLIKLLLKELEPTSGTIQINNINIGNIKKSKLPILRRNIGVVFQNFRLLTDRTVEENIAFAQKVIEAPHHSIKGKVLQMLSMVSLVDKHKSYPQELSGGQQQRVAIARALINNPPILLADEPTGNLDEENAWEIMKLLENANAQGTTVVVVTHNIEMVRAMRKRTICIESGEIVKDIEEGGNFYEI